MPRWLYFLLVFSVLTPLLELFHAPELLVFVVAALGIIPLAALLGQGVEMVAEHTGEQIGGLLFATFGNATELIISLFALSAGLVDVVRASLIGSILGNALLVLGVSVLIGSIKHGRLHFKARPASQYSSLLALCVGGLMLPTIAELLAAREHQSAIALHGEQLSDVVAILLLLGYLASILFSVFRIGDKGGSEEDFDPVIGARSMAAISRLLTYRHHIAKSDHEGKSGVLRQIDSAVHAIVEHEAGGASDAESPGVVPPALPPSVLAGVVPATPATPTAPAVPAGQKNASSHAHGRKRPVWQGILLLAAATAGVAVLSEILVSSIEPVTETLGWSPAFVGLIFLPLIGGLPEYFNTISMALDKRMGMVLAASAGSSIQIALLVAPLLVLVSLFTVKRLDLVFSLIELAVLALAAFLFSEITRDGELVWLEGLLLILLYCMMGGTVFLFG
jgi:Ca2+:H+ antiporter